MNLRNYAPLAARALQEADGATGLGCGLVYALSVLHSLLVASPALPAGSKAQSECTLMCGIVFCCSQIAQGTLRSDWGGVQLYCDERVTSV